MQGEGVLRGLGVEKGVSHEQLVGLQKPLVWRHVTPHFGADDLPLQESGLVVRQLLDEALPDFEVGSAPIQKLKGLEQRPPVLAHQVGGEHRASSRLATNRVHKHGFSLLRCFVDEVVYLTSDLVLQVIQDLVLAVVPIEGQVDDAYVFPAVLHLPTRAVYYPRNFVREDEFQVLSCPQVQVNGFLIQLTCDANSSPIKSPSTILIAPIASSEKSSCGGWNLAWVGFCSFG